MKKKDIKKSKKVLLWILDLGINIVIIFGLVIIIQTWIMAPFDVSGGSMCNTLNYVEGKCLSNYGEKIIINEALYLVTEPDRGDIVVFNVADRELDEEDKYYIKRVIGLPGDSVKIENGEVYLKELEKDNYEKLEENYLNDYNKGNTKTYFNTLKTFDVPENNYFVLGDNRNASTDSRSCFQNTLSSDCKNNPEDAYVSKDEIRGKASLVWWPLSSFRVISEIDYSLEETSEST